MFVRVYWGGGNFDIGNYYPRVPIGILLGRSAFTVVFKTLSFFTCFGPFFVHVLFSPLSFVPVLLCYITSNLHCYAAISYLYKTMEIS